VEPQDEFARGLYDVDETGALPGTVLRSGRDTTTPSMQ
jgi:hypothetical protein